MKQTTFLLVLLMFLSGIAVPQSSWYSQSSGVSENLYAVEFTDCNTGYVCGSGSTILKTTNSGGNWSILKSGSGPQLTGISFKNDTVGFCCGYNTVLKTTNAGISWFTVFEGIQVSDIQCIDSVVYCGGLLGVYKSTNEGANWTNTMSNYSGSIFGISFTCADTGYAMGSNAATRWTSNGGAVWSSGLFWGPGEYTFSDCQFFNSGSGYVCFGFNSGFPNFSTSYGIYKANSWFSWHNVFISPNVYVAGISFPGNDTAYAVGGSGSGQNARSVILKSTNGGNNWVEQSFSVNKVLNSVFFINTVKGFAVGNSGVILMTESGGAVPVEIFQSNIPARSYLHQNFPNPFNPSTIIDFDLKASAYVSLKVFDMLGREVAVIAEGNRNAGSHEVRFDAADLPGGLYFYSLYADGEISGVRKMFLLK